MTDGAACRSLATDADTGALGLRKAGPHATRLDDDEGQGQPRPESGNYLQDRGWECGAFGGSEAYEDDADLSLPACQDELSEVLVFREQYPPAFKRESYDIFIGRSAGDLGNGNDIVTVAAERADNGEVATLVGQELQSRSRLQLLVEVVTSSSWETVSAAYARAARIPSRVRCGYASSTSASVAPSLNFRTTRSTVIRVPRMTGLPSMTAGSMEMRESVIGFGAFALAILRLPAIQGAAGPRDCFLGSF